MEIRQFRYFVSVVREESFSRASHKLKIAQPAISRQIQMLEDEFGVKLLDRTAKGVHVTEAGREFMKMAESVLRYIGTIKTAVSSISDLPSGIVLVGLPPTLATSIATPLFKAVRDEYSQVKVRIVEGFSVFLSEWLEQSKIDIALLTDYGPIPGIKRRKVADEDLVFVGTPSRVKKRKNDTVTLAELANYPMIISNGIRNIVEPWLLSANLELEFEMELDSIPLLVDLVTSGDYCTILPYSLVHNHARKGRIVALKITKNKIQRRIVTAVQANRTMSAAMTAVEDILIREVKKLTLCK